jgi:hypothetical protein
MVATDKKKPGTGDGDWRGWRQKTSVSAASSSSSSSPSASPETTADQNKAEQTKTILPPKVVDKADDLDETQSSIDTITNEVCSHIPIHIHTPTHPFTCIYTHIYTQTLHIHKHRHDYIYRLNR